MKLSAHDLTEMKKQSKKIVMATCYDYPTAVLADTHGIDVQLIGDSVGTNVLGYRDVTEVTVPDMVHHCRAVARGAAHSFVLCDMPYGSFADNDLALATASSLKSAGADGIKMEGEFEVVGQMKHLVAHGFSVCAHIGYTPQTDGTRASVQGKDAARAIELLRIALELQGAGACMMVLELLPRQLAGEISALLEIPTIGIGAGAFCDGQVQVMNDILGLSSRTYRHAKTFGSVGLETGRSLDAYVAEVHAGTFPGEQHAASLPDTVLETVRSWIATNHS